MKAVILAGGFGTRISEETDIKPKPMIEIGGKPILWHILKMYSAHGINEFIICLGYKSYVIKEYFANYFLHMSDITFDIGKNKVKVHRQHAEPWKISLIDTGDETQTGGRIKRIQEYVGDEDFCLTYGDGVSDVDIKAVIEHHNRKKTKATVTAVRPPGRFGALDIQDGMVQAFQEKPQGDGTWINGGFFVLQPSIFDYIDGDETLWEQEPLKNLTKEGELAVYKHDGFWQPMDTLREKKLLEKLWDSGNAPWKTWQ